MYCGATGDDWQVFKLLRFVVAAFFIATVVSTFLDLSLGSKLMPGSSVHMAETSDKTFEDVVGIDEVSVYHPSCVEGIVSQVMELRHSFRRYC